MLAGYQTTNATELGRPNTMKSVIHNPRVPYDLLRPMFEHLQQDTASLCAISLASSTCRDEAQRILFRRVGALIKYSSHLKFLRTVAASPTRLALFVHAYIHSWTIESRAVEDIMKVLPNIVRDGLKAMFRLKELTIYLTYSLRDSHTMYIHILSTCTFRLERFHWWIWRNLNELVEKFLVYQPTLRRLVLSNGFFTDKLPIIPSTMCPLLVSMSADWNIIKAFLPGRKISTLRLTGGEIEKAEIKSLAAELNRVKSLSIFLTDLLWMKQVNIKIRQYFPFVNTLEIRESKVLQNFFVQHIISHHLAVLPELPALQTLILTRSDKEPSTPRDDTELTHDVFAKFGEYLKRIDIGIEGESYSRYDQFQETVQKITVEEALELWL